MPSVMTTRIALAIIGSIFGINVAHSSPFIGAEQCQVCHASQYAQWQGTAHARSHLKLSMAERRDPRCGACHNTSTEDGLLGVQCESCHGPGERYWPADIMGNPRKARAAGLWITEGVSVCKNCHTATGTRLLPFNFGAALSKVHHRKQETSGENQ
jgi:hypothetical protein